MARIATKQNWTSDPDNAPLPSDFNRIENNNQQAFDELDAEVIRATADVDTEESSRIADVDAEEARATAAEGTLQTNINNEASTRSTNDGTLQTNINSEASARTAITTALMTANAIGSYAFLKNVLGESYLVGQLTSPSAVLQFSSIGGGSGAAASGIWRTMGTCPLGDVTLFVRVS